MFVASFQYIYYIVNGRFDISMSVEVCGVALDEADLRRLSEADVLNDKVGS